MLPAEDGRGLNPPTPNTPEVPLLGRHREPPRAHLAAVALLALLTLLRFWPHITDPAPLPDEMGYVRGIGRLLAGGSPYPGGSYLYPPLVAYAGAWGWQHLGPGAVLGALRGANVLGAAGTVWCALVWLPWSWRRRVAAGALYLAVAPIVRLGVEWGNLSLAVGGLIALGLLIWPRRPALAGALLGTSLAIKPLAPVAVLALLAHRPRAGGRRHWLAAAVAGAVTAALVLPFPHWRGMLSVPYIPAITSRSLSFHRLAFLLGLEVDPLAVTAALALATVLLVRLRPLGRLPLYGIAAAATLAASPSVWSHALHLTLPLQALALAAAWERLARAPEGERPRRRRELVFVALAAAAIQLSEGATVLDDQPAWLELPGVLAPVLAPGALAWYLTWVGPATAAAATRTRNRCPDPGGRRG